MPGTVKAQSPVCMSLHSEHVSLTHIMLQDSAHTSAETYNTFVT